LVKLAVSGTEPQKANAAAALANLAYLPENKIAIADAGGIPPLVALATSGTDHQKVNAAGALKNLADNNDPNRLAIAKAGGVAALVWLTRAGTEKQRLYASRALRNLAANSTVKAQIDSARVNVDSVRYKQ
jgi:hypothetical protein